MVFADLEVRFHVRSLHVMPLLLQIFLHKLRAFYPCFLKPLFLLFQLCLIKAQLIATVGELGTASYPVGSLLQGLLHTNGQSIRSIPFYASIYGCNGNNIWAFRVFLSVRSPLSLLTRNVQYYFPLFVILPFFFFSKTWS